MLAFWFVVMILASGQVVETWRHGSLFYEWRQLATKNVKQAVRPRKLWKLLSCPFCFSHWPGLPLWIWFGLTGVLPETWSWWARMPCLWLATIRASQLIADYSHPFNRSPLRDEDLVVVHESLSAHDSVQLVDPGE